jgi:PTS system ascorbate-specific IIA component
MTALILTCHAPLGQALHAVACHAFGRYIADVLVADISANSSLDEATATIEKIWIDEGRPTEVLLLADLLGATPSNAAAAWMSLHPELHVTGLTGVSVPMMLKALTYRDLPAQQLAEKLADCVAPNCAPISPAA